MGSTPKNKKAMNKDEVVCLVDLIESNAILMSKETNATTNKLKEEAWELVTTAYNVKCGSIPKHKDQLKLKWDNLKKASRKRACEVRLNNLKIGGGKPDFIPPDEILDRVANLLGSTCSGFQVPFGGDSISDGSVVFELDVNEHEYHNETQEQDDTDKDAALLPSTSGAKKRKLNFDCQEENLGDKVGAKFLFRMPIMSKALQSRGKKKKEKRDDGRLECNMAIARYYDKKAEKLDLEIKLLKLELANKKNNQNN